jgi:outer membrane receptor protein involved in Fe transport
MKHLDSGLDGAKHPKDLSFYVQNKYEKDQLVVNAGLRYDYINSETEILADEANPLLYAVGGDTLTSKDLKSGKSHNKLSPRIGIGFPVSDRTQFHANYGIFYQQPNLEDLYVGYNYVGYKVFSGGYYYPFGNPDLLP